MATSKRQEKALEYLRHNETATVEELARALQLERWTTRNVLVQLERKGLVDKKICKRVGYAQKRHVEKYAVYFMVKS